MPVRNFIHLLSECERLWSFLVKILFTFMQPVYNFVDNAHGNYLAALRDRRLYIDQRASTFQFLLCRTVTTLIHIKSANNLLLCIPLIFHFHYPLNPFIYTSLTLQHINFFTKKVREKLRQAFSYFSFGFFQYLTYSFKQLS